MAQLGTSTYRKSTDAGVVRTRTQRRLKVSWHNLLFGTQGARKDAKAKGKVPPGGKADHSGVRTDFPCSRSKAFEVVPLISALSQFHILRWVSSY